MSRRADAVSGSASIPELALPEAHAAGVGPASMTKLLATARAELDRHVNADGTCQACRDEWPCETACLAAFTLEAVSGR